MSGSGNITVNEKTAEEYFTRLGDLQNILAPIQAAGEDQAHLDIKVVVRGGGVNGQTDAVQMGMARA
jgi:small subunit ribosomal protein S9